MIVENPKELLKNLEKISCVSDKRCDIAVFDKNSICVTNTRVYAKVFVNCEFEMFLAKTKDFIKALKELNKYSDAPLNVELTESDVILTKNDKSINIKRVCEWAFPALNLPEANEKTEIYCVNLFNALKETIGSINRDDETRRKFSNEACFNFDGETLEVTCTDGCILSCKRTKILSSITKRVGVHRVCVDLLYKSMSKIKDSWDKCIIGFTKKTIFFGFDNIRVHCAISGYEFPSFRNVYPNEDHSIIVDRKEILSDVKEILNRINDEKNPNNAVEIIFAKDRMILMDVKCRDIEYSLHSETTKGTDTSIIVNAKYLKKTLENSAESEVKFVRGDKSNNLGIFIGDNAEHCIARVIL